MSKRAQNGATDLADLSRPKRPRRESALHQADTGATSDVDVLMSGHEGSDAEAEVNENSTGPKVLSLEEVKTLGLSLWQTVRDGTSKDGRQLGPPFFKKVPKRSYPDYYEIIKQPIAFDDIKSKLDKSQYLTLEAVRQDFELCFNNAMLYNAEGSDIWVDAKDLLKITNKAFNKLIPGADAGKKNKPPSMNKLLKSRLQKVVDKKDASGRVVSIEFMELPSRKDWPDYYKIIKKPQCFNGVFKRLKRKDYNNSEEFAADVEIIFENAMTFNHDHSPIWNDAVILRNTFRQVMADLPPPHTLSRYAQAPTKISLKIRPPGTQASSSGSQLPSLTLRVPAPPSAQKPAPPKVEPSLPVARNTASSLPVARNTGSTLPVARNTAKPIGPTPAPATVPPATKAAPPPKLPVMKATATARPQPPPPAPRHTPAPAQYTTPVIQAYPSNQSSSAAPSYSNVQPAPPPIIPPLQVQPQVIQKQSATPAPAPNPAPPPAPTSAPVHQHQLKCARVEIQPRGRVVYMDYRDGVKSWAIRLGIGESKLLISDVTWLNQHIDDDEESSEEEQEEEEEEDEMEVDVTPVKRGPGRPRKKGNKRPGRPTRVSVRVATLKSGKKDSANRSSKPGAVQIKLNGTLVNEESENSGQWEVTLPPGYGVVEMGEEGGMVWKLYVDRVGSA